MPLNPKSKPAHGRANQLPALQQRLGPVEYRDPASLTAYSRNPRVHPEKQIVKLMAGIEQFGFPLPVLVDEDRVIVCGHARIEAAKRLKLTEVPVIVASQWSRAKVKAFRLMDNRISELSYWDNDILAIELAEVIELEEVTVESLGWDNPEIDLIMEGAKKNGASSDRADVEMELPDTPMAQLGDLFLLGKHRLLCGSSLDSPNWVRLMAGELADMVCVDMPFNVPVNGHVCGLGKIKHLEFQQASGEMDRPQFATFLTDMIGEMAGPLKDGGVLALFMDWRHILEMQMAIEANGLSMLNLCIWNKTNGGMGSLYRSKYELVFIAKKGTASHTNNVQLGKYGRYRTNVWDYAGVNTFSKSRMTDLAAHPTVKPVALLSDAIRDVTNIGETVLDGCMGSGSLILAAERTNRKAYGIEIEPRYIDVAIRRWQEMTGQDATLAETGETFAELCIRREAEAYDASGADEDDVRESDCDADDDDDFGEVD